MVLPIFPMIWVNHRKKHQWYSHIIWKLLALSASRLACNSFMACILHMYPYDWASMRKPWHVHAASTGGLLKVFLFNIPGNCSNRWYTIPPENWSQNSQANSAEVLAGITTLKIWARPQYGIFHWVVCSGRVIGFQYFQWFLCLATSGHYNLHCSACAKPDETFEVSRARFEESWKLILPSGNLTHEAMENSRLSFLNIYIYFVGNTEFTLQFAMLVDCSVLQYLNRFFTTCPVSFRCQLHAEWHQLKLPLQTCFQKGKHGNPGATKLWSTILATIEIINNVSVWPL